MTENLATAPNLFAELRTNTPHGFTLSEGVVEPVVLVCRAGDVYQACLAGRYKAGSERLIAKALSDQHNWIAAGTRIRPLPIDAQTEIDKLLQGRNRKALSFSDVISLSREHGSMDVEFEDGVLEPAAKTVEKVELQLAVPGLNATLYPYQTQGVRWMLESIQRTGGLILADEMGLGKTIQILSLLLLRPPSEEKPALVVCPTSLIANWQREIFQFAPDLSVMIHRGSDRTGIYKGLQKSQIVVTTYETVVIDQSIFRGVTWSWLICDEAQALKNPDSERHLAIASLPREKTIPVTGTPVETSLLNLWALTEIAIPGLLGNRDDFESYYEDNDDTSAELLGKITGAIILRRLVADVAGDLPDRIETDVPLELDRELASLYNQIRNETMEKYPTAGSLVATGQLQLFCAHPWLQYISGESNEEGEVIEDSEIPLFTPKIERTINILQESFSSDRKVLIFSGYNGCIELIRKAAVSLPDAFWSAINGSTPQDQRQDIVDRFSNFGGPGCLVLNPKAAGTGLNITAATVVIHFTLAWNPALELQASARAHRRGQTEPVYIYRLFYENTVEQVMLDRARWRKQMGDAAVPTSTRDNEDLARALELNPFGETD